MTDRRKKRYEQTDSVNLMKELIADAAALCEDDTELRKTFEEYKYNLCTPAISIMPRNITPDQMRAIADSLWNVSSSMGKDINPHSYGRKAASMIKQDHPYVSDDDIFLFGASLSEKISNGYAIEGEIKKIYFDAATGIQVAGQLSRAFRQKADTSQTHALTIQRLASIDPMEAQKIVMSDTKIDNNPQLENIRKLTNKAVFFWYICFLDERFLKRHRHCIFGAF